jgi:hypothetical protein
MEDVVDYKYFDYQVPTYDEELETWLFLDACEPVPESLSCIMVGRRASLKLCFAGAVTKWKPRWSSWRIGGRNSSSLRTCRLERNAMAR